MSAGRGREMLALPPPEPTQRITLFPHSTPLHKLQADTLLPLQLLSPFQVRWVPPWGVWGKMGALCVLNYPGVCGREYRYGFSSVGIRT